MNAPLVIVAITFVVLGLVLRKRNNKLAKTFWFAGMAISVCVITSIILSSAHR